MTKVLSFKVEIEGLEDKIWRIIEITDKRTVADLAYAILASFNSLAYHLYNIRYNNKLYDCWIAIDDYHEVEEPINAIITRLDSIGLKENDRMVMEYDFGSTTTFKITYLKEREFEKGNGMHYPFVIDGSGAGMIDDICDFELKRIVDDIDKKGYSEYYYTPGYRDERIYDYREFNIDRVNLQIRRYYHKIKHEYEDWFLYDND